MLKYDEYSLKPLKEMYFEKGINCIKFNKLNENIIHAGDFAGNLIMINYNYNKLEKEKINSNKIHQNEITSLNTGKISKNLLLSTSSDNSSKLIDLNNNKIVLNKISKIFQKKDSHILQLIIKLQI